MDPEDPAAVARFDRKRKDRKTSNKEWYNPNDPDAKVGRTKDGACDMIYKPEHIVDLESGAILSAEVRLGDAGDTEDLSTRILQAVELAEEIHGQDSVGGSSRVRDITGDKGFHSPEELAIIQEEPTAGRPPAARLPRRGERQRSKPEPKPSSATPMPPAAILKTLRRKPAKPSTRPPAP